MEQDVLSRARSYEAAHAPSAQPGFHLTAGVGWLNDPNGFSLYRGEYHLFFQYNPYSTYWDTMHWGHAKSKDLIRWERLPCALAPDQPYENASGCFSGSGIALPDGRHLLMYTAVAKSETYPEVQTQCLAFGDGVDYEKYADNPVITAEQLPEGGSPVHFRDPKLWAHNGGYRVVLGNLEDCGSGAVLMYESDDAIHWRFVSRVAGSDNRLGVMWECPDLFPLDGKDVLLVSPQEMHVEGGEFLEGNTTLCLIGKLDENGTLRRESEHTIDYGVDFYATQTLLTADGRRVMIAWMQYWNSVDVRPDPSLPFFGQMTLPRELHVRGGRLIQNPVRELEAYRKARVCHADVPVSGKTTLEGVGGRSLDLTVTVRPCGETLYRGFTINVAEGGAYATSICYEPHKDAVTVDRTRGGWPESVLNRRTFPVRASGGVIKLRLILDRYSVELFVNDGEQAASVAIFSPAEADGVSFSADGEAIVTAEQFTLDII